MNFYNVVYKRVTQIYFELQFVSLRLRGASIAKGAKCFGSFSFIGKPSNLVIEDDVSINAGVHINARAKLIIGKGTHVSTNVQIHTGFLDLESFLVEQKHDSLAINIGEHVWIAAGCVVSAGANIPNHAVFAANSVILNKKYEAATIYTGNPASPLRKL